MDYSTTVQQLNDEWSVLDEEYQKLEDAHKSFQLTVAKLNAFQNQCFKEIHHQNYRIGQISQSLRKSKTENDEEKALKEDLVNKISSRKAQISDVQDSLPKPNGPYLKIILGGINVSLADQDQRFKYKEQYERFKLVVTSIILVIAIFNIIVHYRALDALLHFLLVWYHCTLTIRESILVVNGSRIKGWWRVLQFITLVQAGVMIVWPDGLMYNLFRVQFLYWTCYTSFLQFLQFYYQQGCLYRLRALGERYQMDITIEGFHSWMWKGLGFLLPFLFLGYLYQIYNAYVLYKLSFHEQCTEWQVIVNSALFFTLFLGNIFTTASVIYQKITEKTKTLTQKLKLN